MRSLTRQTILVFGGSGFLGTHLINRLIELKAHPVIADLTNQVDITNSAQINRLIGKGWDAIINLAGVSGTVSNQRKVQASFSGNVLGAINILEAAKKLSRPPVLFFSNSRQEYGLPRYLPVNETHPAQPINLYGVHKLAITQLAQLYARNYQLPTITFRTSNVYGPSHDRQVKDYNIVNQWLKSSTITLFGPGRQLRDYLFIDDWVKAVIQSLTTPKAYGQIFNIGYGQGLSLLAMAKSITRLTGAKVIKKSWPKEYQAVETGSYISDISKAKKLLGWHPAIDFTTGVSKTFAQQ